MLGNEKITVAKTHTDEMVRDELKAMLGVGQVHLTLGALASLVVLHSPYIYGGKVTEEALADAYGVVPHGNLGMLEFHEALQEALDTAFRAFELIVPDATTDNKPSKTSEIEIYSPEWFSDVISQACHAMPSLTYRQLMDETPLTLVFHLAVSTARRNGAITSRPNDVKEAIKQFNEMRNKK